MISFKTFCKHYGLDASSPDAKKDYREYQRQLSLLEGVCKSNDLKHGHLGEMENQEKLLSFLSRIDTQELLRFFYVGSLALSNGQLVQQLIEDGEFDNVDDGEFYSGLGAGVEELYNKTGIIGYERETDDFMARYGKDTVKGHLYICDVIETTKNRKKFRKKSGNIIDLKGIVPQLKQTTSIEDMNETIKMRAAKEYHDLSSELIKAILAGLEEIKRGNVSEYVFGFDETEYLLSSPENAKRLNLSIEQIEKGLAKKYDLEEFEKLTNKVKSSIKRASDSLDKGINDAKSFIKEAKTGKSPLDVPSIDTKATTQDILDTIRESRALRVKKHTPEEVGITALVEQGGDGLIITLPPDILDALGLKIGDDVNIEMDKSGFVVSPACKEVKNDK